MIVKLLTEQHLKFLQKEAAQVRLSLHLSLVGNHMSGLKYQRIWIAQKSFKENNFFHQKIVGSTLEIFAKVFFSCGKYLLKYELKTLFLLFHHIENILNKSENATSELCAIYIQNDASQ